MNFSQAGAELHIPSGGTVASALERTTLLGVSAHQDDLEFMAYGPILRGFTVPGEAFSGVVVANGAGSARDGRYAAFTDAEMIEVRREEQRKAAHIGAYAALFQLGHGSGAVKDPAETATIDDLEAVLRATRPREVYTHNPADKHDTHVAVLVKLLAALRRLPANERPLKLVGCEVWRDLDWMCDQDKVLMPVDGHENLGDALMGVFDSQICGGKRYDLAVRGRRKANATFFESHATDEHENLIFGMDLTPLLHDDSLSPQALFGRHLASFQTEVLERLDRLTGPLQGKPCPPK
jgi:LmbE family N-acetylglucosaminyl deacetylase